MTHFNTSHIKAIKELSTSNFIECVAPRAKILHLNATYLCLLCQVETALDHLSGDVQLLHHALSTSVHVDGALLSEERLQITVSFV